MRARYSGRGSLDDVRAALVTDPTALGWFAIRSGRVPTDGALGYRRPDGLLVLVTLDLTSDGGRWLHVSFSRANELPSWADVGEVKGAFVGPDRVAVQVFPRANEHVNLHPWCLHLWCRLDADAVPDLRPVVGGL